MTEQHETYPNGLEALCLVAVLFFVEVLVANVFDAAGLFSEVGGSDRGGLITIAGNGVLFIALLAYKRLNYAGLFHPARYSVLATLSLLSVPVLLVVPGLIVCVSLIGALLVALFPMTPYEAAIFEEMTAGGAKLLAN